MYALVRWYELETNYVNVRLFELAKYYINFSYTSWVVVR